MFDTPVTSPLLDPDWLAHCASFEEQCDLEAVEEATFEAVRDGRAFVVLEG
jgi:hypothetical protein